MDDIIIFFLFLLVVTLHWRFEDFCGWNRYRHCRRRKPGCNKWDCRMYDDCKYGGRSTGSLFASPGLYLRL